MADDFSAAYRDLLDGTYECVDRLVLNAYNPLCASPGGFRIDSVLNSVGEARGGGDSKEGL